MQLGFVSAIFHELKLEQVFRFAAETGFATVEVMCWPVGQPDRRYGGVTHIDVSNFKELKRRQILDLVQKHGVSISALGYYPNPLCADPEEAEVAISHLTAVITAAQKLGITQVNTFVGRDQQRSLEDNWPLFNKRWPAIVKHAENSQVRIGIENCPMFFSGDEWPGGRNLAVSPLVWRNMFARIPSPNFGLNYDPSHLVWQFMDPVQPILAFGERIFHVHAKDVRLDREKLNHVGILANPSEYHTPKLPGLGEVKWGEFFAALTEVGYKGPVCIEVEDRAYEGSLEDRKRALRQSKRFLENFIS